MAVELTDGSPVPGEASDKIMALVSGLAGVGKSGLGLSFPGPLWMYNLDRPIGHFKSAWAKRKLKYEAVSIDVDVSTPGIAMQYLQKFDNLVREAISSGTNGTFIVDGWDIFWDLVKLAKVKNLDSDVPKEYAPANEYMNNHLRRLGLSKLNVVFTTMASQVWTGMKTETERMKSDGFKHKDRWLTHEIYLFAPDKMETPLIVPVQAKLGQSHMAYIARSKLNETLIGRVLPGLTFAMLYKLTFGHAYDEPDRLWTPASLATSEA